MDSFYLPKIDPPPHSAMPERKRFFVLMSSLTHYSLWFWLLCRSNFHSNNYIFVKASIPTCPMRWDFDCRLLIHASGWNKNYIQICSVLCSWVQQKIYYKFLPKSWKSNSSSAKITYNPPHRQGYLRIQEKERMRVNVKAHITIAGSKYACPST